MEPVVVAADDKLDFVALFAPAYPWKGPHDGRRLRQEVEQQSCDLVIFPWAAILQKIVHEVDLQVRRRVQQDGQPTEDQLGRLTRILQPAHDLNPESRGQATAHPRNGGPSLLRV